MDKTKLNLERLRAYDAEWEEDKHPRGENGQFTSGSGSTGGSANGSSESSAKSHNLLAEPKSPLRHAAETIQGGGGKKDTNYTANGQQTKADKTIRENPNYVGNDEVYKLLGGKNNVDYFKFITPISARGNMNSADDVTVEYGEVYYDDKGERRVSTSTTTFYADKIFKSL
nr:MAG TPA: hypothetical protein [Caudoviricetes sp.]